MTCTTLTRFHRDARRLTTRIVRKLTRKAAVTLTITVSLPPFLTIVLTYKRPANDDVSQHNKAA